MTKESAMPMERRRKESIADRQARVGIVANPKRMPLKTPVPRDVWTRWPDLRSAHRRKTRLLAGAHVPPQAESDPLAGFVRSVRGVSSAQAKISTNTGFAARRSGKRRVLIAISAVTLGVGLYLVHLAILSV